MRTLFSSLCLIVLLGVAMPAQAQMRTDVQLEPAPAKLYGGDGPSFALNKLFSPQHFRMGHSFEMSASSFGGGTSLAMYTNTMAWQFSPKLAARVDVSYMMAPFGGEALGFNQDQPGRLFLRNAEIAYRPKENMVFHFSVRQSPYGSYMGPYGAYGPGAAFYGHQPFGVGSQQQRLFWNDAR